MKVHGTAGVFFLYTEIVARDLHFSIPIPAQNDNWKYIPIYKIHNGKSLAMSLKTECQAQSRQLACLPWRKRSLSNLYLSGRSLLFSSTPTRFKPEDTILGQFQLVWLQQQHAVSIHTVMPFMNT